MNAVDIMVRKAESMAKTLETRALAAERDGKISAETVRELSTEGLFSLVKPAIYGGKELSAAAVLKVCAALGKGCASTGWLSLIHI